jgi:DNA-binding response OmpR family regulator
MKKVLIVDDDRWLAENYQLVLEAAGWNVTLSATAAEAIDVIDDLQPHVVLLDVMLPWSSAAALLNELQSHSDIASLPIVLCSSLDVSHLALSDLAEYGVRQVIDKTTVMPDQIVSILMTAAHATA